MKSLLSITAFLSIAIFIQSCGTTVTQLAVTQLAVNNPSFESFTVPGGVGDYTSNGQGFTGWTLGNGTDGGIFRPGPANFTNVPNGTQTAWLYNQTICQILTSPVVEKASYSLMVEVGRDAISAYSGYRIQLRAGGVLLTEDNNTKNPPSGGWVTAQVQYIASSGDENAGELLEICLSGLSNGEADFDNVRLEQSL